jgi:diguanylate cyclase (GGDEF)-like protein
LSAATTDAASTRLNAYVTSVIALGFAALVLAVARTGLGDLIGDHPSIYWIFLGLFFAAELFPLQWLRRHEGGELTASWTFAFALVFVNPASGTLLGVFCACCLSDLIHRKPVVKALFNAAQVSLSLGVGIVVMEVLSDRDALTDGDPHVWWFGAFLLMCVVVLVLNSAFTGAVLGLVQRLPLWQMVRSGISRNLATDGMLVALAPIFVVVALRSLLFVPLLVLTAWAVYRSAQMGLTHQHEATHDRLTGLPNRRLFDEQAVAARYVAKQRQQGLAVVLVDLDRFKQINDHLGQHVGDLCLQEVATRFLEVKRSSDLVARIGGDKFAVVVAGFEHAGVPEQVARTLLDALRPPCVVEGVPVAVSGSIGIATYPDHGEEVDVLLQHAELAVYTAKQGVTGFATYEPVEDQRSRGRWNLISGLPEAIREQQLVLHYQPKLECRTGQLKGGEALVRWQHPQHGLVPPNQFMPFAENTEFIQPLTEHILRMALTQCAAWKAAGVDLRVAVNASTRNLHDLRFPSIVAALLVETGLTADALELEITENTVMSDPLRSTRVLTALRDQGIRISVDDFGTGYSSLAHLRELPIDCVKIDQSFVTDMATDVGDLAIVRAIIDLARNLGLETVAEGIETPESWALLQELGCDLGQGYLISRPMPAAALAGWVGDHDPCRWRNDGGDARP